MRTAASRLFGVGAAVGGVGGVIRGSQSSVPKPEHQTPFTPPRPPAAASVVLVENKAVSSLDDWELAGVEVNDDSSPLPRVVFGAAPSFDEAKEATLELKAAVHKSVSTQSF